MHLIYIKDCEPTAPEGARDRIVNLDHLAGAHWSGAPPHLILDLADGSQVRIRDGEAAHLVWRMLSRLAVDPLTETVRRNWPEGRPLPGPPA